MDGKHAISVGRSLFSHLGLERDEQFHPAASEKESTNPRQGQVNQQAVLKRKAIIGSRD